MKPIKHTSPFYGLFVFHSVFHIVFLVTLVTIVAFISLIPSTVFADKIRVAVASNFTHTIKSLAKNFEEETGHDVVLIFGATGRHYAQIKNGAPFDAFFSADSKHPALLEKEGLAHSRFTYALGKLVLWSPQKSLVDPQTKVLETMDFNHIAIANPKLAPYGTAARETLQNLHLWDKIKLKAVRGENIAQAFQFVKSGNAELGFIAQTQLTTLNKNEQGSLWKVPNSLYKPIKQQVVLLNKNAVAQAFLKYIKTSPAQEIIAASGYGIEHD